MRPTGLFVALAVLVLVVPAVASGIPETTVSRSQRTVNLYIPAVGQGDDGQLFGVLSVLTLTAERPGRGDVFVRTQPLAEVDMQGAARLAVLAAGEFSGQDINAWDYYFTVTTDSPIIGGPSAGAAMSAAATSILMDWELDPDVSVTGMINPDLSVGPVGGLLHKAEALASVNVETFLIPAGQRVQYTVVATENPDGTVSRRQEAVDVVQAAQQRWGLEVVEVEDLYEALGAFTGRDVRAPTADVDPLVHQTYQALMAEVSQSQRANATSLLDLARTAFGAVSAEMGTSDREAVEAHLASAEEGLRRADEATAATRHYQSSSFSFQSLVQSRSALAFTGFYTTRATSPAGYARDYLEQIEAALAEARAALPARPFPWTSGELGGQAAVEFRFQDAEGLLADARTALGQGEIAASLQNVAFAHERVGSAYWWAILRDRAGGLAPNETVTQDGLEALGEDLDVAASLTVAYAARVLEEAGGGSEALTGATDELALAQRAAQEGRLASGVYGFLRVQSMVSGAMAALNPPENLVNRLATLRDRAAYEIEVARAEDVEPLFAVSVFEFAEFQAENEPAAAYESLTLARLAARVTLTAAGYQAPAARIPPLPLELAYSPDQRSLQGAAWAFLVLVAVPGALALGLAGVIASATAPRGKK